MIKYYREIVDFENGIMTIFQRNRTYSNYFFSQYVYIDII